MGNTDPTSAELLYTLVLVVFTGMKRIADQGAHPPIGDVGFPGAGGLKLRGSERV